MLSLKRAEKRRRRTIALCRTVETEVGVAPGEARMAGELATAAAAERRH